jgi:hypothetical protein
MDGCTNKTAKAIQGSCFQGCEGKNTICAEKVYGKRPLNVAPAAASAAAEPKDAPQEALAKTDSQAVDARDQAPKQAPPEPQRPRQPARR